MMQSSAPDYNQPENKNQMPRPYVRFETRSQEIRGPQGKPEYKDVVWALVMAAGGKDVLEKEAEAWINGLREHAKAGRIPASWPSDYEAALAGFIKGEEMPLHGTPIKTWSALTPAQRKSVSNANIFTVEDLALANDDARARIGMGALGLIEMAKAWVAESKGNGALAAQVAQLAARLEDLSRVNADQAKTISELNALVPKPEKVT